MELQALVAREQIRDLVARYSFATDRGWFPELMGLFAADAVLVLGGVEHVGAAAIRAAVGDVAGRHPHQQRHLVGTLAIDVLSCEHASARSYFQVLTARGLDHWGHYSDAFVCRDGRWLFSRREVHVDGATPGGWAALRASGPEHAGRHDGP